MTLYYIAIKLNVKSSSSIIINNYTVFKAHKNKVKKVNIIKN